MSDSRAGEALPTDVRETPCGRLPEVGGSAARAWRRTVGLVLGPQRFETAPGIERPTREKLDSRKSLRILLYGGSAAFQSPGGGEVQLLRTAESLRRAGVRAKLFNPWRDKLRDADALHLFGTLPEYLPLVEAARQLGVPTVLSSIAWYDARACWHVARNYREALQHTGKFLLRAALPSWPSWRRALYRQVNLVLPNSHAEARQLQRYFYVPRRKIHVVPNGADARFRAGDPDLFAEMYGVRRYVLYPGRIEPRKNQLTFLRAMQGMQTPVVLLGDPVPAYPDYARACRQVAGAKVQFIPALAMDSPLLASAYCGSACVVLASWFETPGLAALEAALAGRPLVITEIGATREYFGRLAHYVHPNRADQIRAAVEQALDHREAQQHRVAKLAQRVARRFSWTRVAEICREAYEKVVG